jgi:hypothetical protein
MIRKKELLQSEDKFHGEERKTVRCSLMVA